MTKPVAPSDVVLSLRQFNAEEAEEADYVVCINARAMAGYPGYIHTECGICGRGIMHQPSAPQKPMKICFTCALETLDAGEPN